ncbi:MAG: branched-chain amino acid transport system permease protein [Thermoanaerobacteraceae bacterium]|uniref:Branched-chain amino acid ABC transporter permease n=1 Tax=Biomaibacter acetigenes TaxID=2316383 RepID=A0A3G2R7S6_9FIRM|nr:branched-chain amino acid ABC transporter permease [Biomaibacter acetigenes]MDK2879087.1 branched-chain amino acid transport system permease protein [Thermoanaerobacteraceae bacterium]RKL62086.1 branched-chain amino acid ABC transporter permease [Thermoanaerobacteraceae bacterium SP2]AYO31584.1 branched-chain amino acid ABC transporter permease [Biomaibacter acetigenes]MDN5302371.1 branched-chain amino acid transport system permease protein [Thermoanaerobacteraceae bacterium]MDN5312600.1 br
MFFSQFFAQVINGLTLGSTYALIALGYTMVYGILELINFAHSEIYMTGAFVGLMMVTVYKLPFAIALLAGMAGSCILGVVIEKVAYKPLRKANRIAPLISAIGVSIFLQNAALLAAGPQARAFPANFKITGLNFGIIQISSLQLLILIISVFLMVGLHFLIQKTKIGQAMRATAQDKETAQLMGIKIDRVISFTFAIGSALGGAAGVLVGVYFNSADPMMGFFPGLKGFVAAVLGGIGNIPGAMVGGLILGLAEVLGAVYMSQYKDAIAFAVLILILLFKPTGLMGRRVQEKV